MTGPAINVCYPDFASKIAAWRQHVLPQMVATARATLRDVDQVATLEQWLNSGGLGLNLGRRAVIPDLGLLHNMARCGDYIRSTIPCDVIGWPAQTVTAGGKCTDWLVVLGAVLTAWRVPWRILTAGDALDPFRHVWLQANIGGGGWVNLDPKGSQEGLNFDERVLNAPTVQTWGRDVMGNGF